MSEILTCGIPGCVGRRDPRSPLCTGHWMRLSLGERNAWTKILFRISAAAVLGDNETLNGTVDEAWEFLNAIIPQMADRQPALNPSATPAAEPSGEIDRSQTP